MLARRILAIGLIFVTMCVPPASGSEPATAKLAADPPLISGHRLRLQAEKDRTHESYRKLCMYAILRTDFADRDILEVTQGILNWQPLVEQELSWSDKLIQISAFQSLLDHAEKEETRLEIYRSAGLAFLYSPVFSRTLKEDVVKNGGSASSFIKLKGWVLKQLEQPDKAAPAPN